MKIGLFGGSFDPVHNGHLLPVRAARHSLDLDQVLYLPTAQPPHKPGQRFAPAYARYVMVEMALLSQEGLLASPYELTLDRPAYTVETVEHFQATQPQDDFCLLVGADAFSELDQWHRWRELVAMIDLAVLVRPGWERQLEADLSPPLSRLRREKRLHFVTNPPWEVSSTQVRQLLARGDPAVAELMPQTVIDYIRKYDLYP